MNFVPLKLDRIRAHYRLGLSESELNSLIAVRNMFVKNFEDSKIIRQNDALLDNDIIAHTFNGFGGFNMNHGCEIDNPVGEIDDGSIREYDCGTRACIAGWMKIHEKGLLNDNVHEIVKVDEPLAAEIDAFVMSFDHLYRSGSNSFTPAAKLFFPHNIVESFDNITLEDAIRAIDNFLYDGDPKWENIL